MLPSDEMKSDWFSKVEEIEHAYVAWVELMIFMICYCVMPTAFALVLFMNKKLVNLIV